MKFMIRSDGEVRILTINGEVTAADATEIAEDLVAVVAEGGLGRRVVLNLLGITVLHPSAVEALLQMDKAAEIAGIDIRLVLRENQPGIDPTESLRLMQVFATYHNEEKVIRSFWLLVRPSRSE